MQQKSQETKLHCGPTVPSIPETQGRSSAMPIDEHQQHTDHHSTSQKRESPDTVGELLSTYRFIEQSGLETSAVKKV
eukprot:15330192-Ditylum_brightwellii.AAC.1